MPTLSVGSKGRADVALVKTVALLVVFVVPAFFVTCDFWKEPKSGRPMFARSQIRSFMGALDNYKLDTGAYPTTEQGLQVLYVKRQGVKQWNGPYLDKALPKDPWGHDYIYKYPGDHGLAPDIICLGLDGQPGGVGPSADIVSWKN
jgi:general secretion pathway protein G